MRRNRTSPPRTPVLLILCLASACESSDPEIMACRSNTSCVEQNTAVHAPDVPSFKRKIFVRGVTMVLYLTNTGWMKRNLHNIVIISLFGLLRIATGQQTDGK
nr:hypothetical protein BgiMline_007419 [Biomphalaria glabrata]